MTFKTLVRLLCGRRFLILSSAFILTACSGDKASELENIIGNGDINGACFGIDLSESNLTAASTRSLVRCLNSNKSIQEYEDLLNSIDDTQLNSLLQLANETLINNTTRLRDVDKTLDQLDGLGVLDRTFTKVADVLENQELLASGLKLFHELSTIKENGQEKLDPNILKSIQALSGDFTRDDNGVVSQAVTVKNARRAIELSLTSSKLKSYKEITEGLNSSIATLFPNRKLEFLTKMGLEYLQAKLRSNDIQGKLMLWGIEDGSLFKAMDRFYEGLCDEGINGSCRGRATLTLDEQIGSVERLMTILNYTQRDTALRPLAELFTVLDAPLYCMGGSKNIPNANDFIMDEMLSRTPIDVPLWLTRDNILKLGISTSMCNLPRGSNGESFGDLVSVLRNLAAYQEQTEDARTVVGRPVMTMTHMLTAFNMADETPMSALGREDMKDYLTNVPENDRYRRFLIDWMGDNSNVNVYTNLSHVLAELVSPNRHVLGNALYLMNYAGPGSQDRKDLQKAVRSILKKRAEFGNGSVKNVYDVVFGSLNKVQAQTLFEVMMGVSSYIDRPTSYVEPLLTETRTALLANNVTPIVDMTMEVTNNTERYKPFFETIFEISHKKEFLNAMRLTGVMMRKGTLKDLMRGLLVMFKSSTNKIPGGPVLIPVPEIEPLVAARDKSVGTRSAWAPKSATWPSDSSKALACLNISLDFPFSNVSNQNAWQSQVRNMAACANVNRNNDELEAFLNYGLNTKVNASQSLLSFIVGWAASIVPSNPFTAKKVYDEFSDLLTDNNKFRDMQFMNRFLPFFLDKQYCAEYEKDANFKCPSGTKYFSVIQAAGRMLGKIKDEKTKLSKLFSSLKTTVENPDIAPVINYLYDIADAADVQKNTFRPDFKVPLNSSPIYAGNNVLRTKLDASVLLHEGRSPTEQIWAEKTYEYYRQTLQYVPQKYTDEAGKIRVGFKDSSEFKKYLYPFFNTVSKGYNLEWFLAFFYYFDHSPYTTEWWNDWMKRLSANLHAVPYYYPGKIPGTHKPTVRILSDLDILELIVVDGDFSLRDVGMEIGFIFKDIDENTTIKYLTMIAQSGNNMTEVLDRMKEELDFFSRIMDRTPFLLKDEARRRLTNLRNLYPAFRALNKINEFTGTDGIKIRVNDLWLIRDLFKSILSATPVADREKYYRNRSSLALVADLTKMGFLREFGTNTWYVDTDQRIKAINHTPLMDFLYKATVIIEDGKRKLNPEIVKLMDFIIRKDCDKQNNNQTSCLQFVDPSRTQFNKRFRLAGKLLDEYFKWSKEDHLRKDQGLASTTEIMKRIGFNLISVFSEIEKTTNDKSLRLNVVSTSVPLLAEEKGVKLITDEIDLVGDLFDDGELAVLTEMLLGSVSTDRANFSKASFLLNDVISKFAANNSELSRVGLDLAALMSNDPNRSFRATINGLKWIKEDPDYLELKPELDRITAQVVDWIAKDTDEHQLRKQIQNRFAQSLGNGELVDLVSYLGNQSVAPNEDRFYQSLRFAGQQSYISKLNEFMEEMRDGLVDLYKPIRFSSQATGAISP